jgi:hypothetical protein
MADGDQNQQNENQEPTDEKPVVFEEWYKGQPENLKTAIEGHVKGLKSALESERGSRKDLEKQLRDLAKKAEAGSEAQKSLEGMANQIGEADRRTAFYEGAHLAGATNLKLAYLAAVNDELFDKRGQVNFEDMKTQYPELFAGAKKPPKGNAGEGKDQQQPAGKGMNEFIRRSAGRT